MAALQFSSIQKRFGSTKVLADISLEIGAGEFISLLGPSGCGKSTLLRLVAGLEQPTAGEIVLQGEAIQNLAPAERDIAMVFQSYALYPHKTVFENVAFPLLMQARLPLRIPLLRRLTPGRRALDGALREEVLSVARMLDMESLLERKPAQLSGGQRQRVALARAMVRRPKVFLMDEPLSNLDAKLRTTARAEIVDLHRRLRATFVYVTHDQIEAMTMSDRVVLMNEGRIQQVGAPMELYDQPANLFVAEFVGSPKINALQARLRDRVILLAGHRLGSLPGSVMETVPSGVDLTLAWRPEAFHLCEPDHAHALAGRLLSLEHLGSEALVRIGLGKAEIVVRLAPGAARHLKVGQPVAARPDFGRMLVFDANGERLTRAAVRAAA